MDNPLKEGNYDNLTIREKIDVFKSMEYIDIFRAVLELEKPEYRNASVGTITAIYDAFLNSSATGILDEQLITELEREAGVIPHLTQELKERVFIDMDGTLCEFKNVTHPEELYQEGYFLELAPHEDFIETVRSMIKDGGTDIYILSAYLMDSEYALDEKNAWLDKYLPELPWDKRLFVPCGDNKAESVPYGIQEGDVLIDDYSVNLEMWERAGGRAIKLMNGINGTKGTWQGERIDRAITPEELREVIERQPERRQLNV